MIAAHAVRLGINVLRSVAEHGRYDLAFDLGHRILRVQCKWAPLRRGVICVNLLGFRLTSRGAVRTTYSTDEIDAVAVYCQEIDRVYLISSAEADGRSSFQLRLQPTQNAQRAAVNWAKNYSLG